MSGEVSPLILSEMDEDSTLLQKESLAMKRFKTLILGLGNFAVGISFASFNAAVPDLVDLYETSTATLTFIMGSDPAGCATAGLLIGFELVTLPNPFFCFLLCMLNVALTTAVTPFAANWKILLALRYVLGVSNGILFSGASAHCLEIWRSGNSEPYTHFIHFMNSLGLVVAPAVATAVFSMQAETLLGLDIISGYFILIALFVLTFLPPFAFMAVKNGHHSAGGGDGNVEAYETKSRRYWSKVMVFVFVFFVGIAPGLAVGSLATAFAAAVGTSRAAGAQIASAFYLCNTLARLVAIGTSTRFKASKTIYICMLLILLPSLAITLLQSQLDQFHLTVLVAAIGCGVGPLYSTLIMIAEEHVPVTDRVSGLLFASMNIGLILFPWLVGQVIQQQPYSVFVSSAVSAAFASCVLLVVAINKKKC